MNCFDFDGVVSLGINPGPNDVIITGRTVEECDVVYQHLFSRNIFIPVYFNPISLAKRTTGTIESRTCSGKHKAAILSLFKANGMVVDKFFEDDEIQIAEISKVHPDLPIVHVVSSLVVK